VNAKKWKKKVVRCVVCLCQRSKRTFKELAETVFLPVEIVSLHIEIFFLPVLPAVHEYAHP